MNGRTVRLLRKWSVAEKKPPYNSHKWCKRWWNRRPRGERYTLRTEIVNYLKMAQ